VITAIGKSAKSGGKAGVENNDDEDDEADDDLLWLCRGLLGRGKPRRFRKKKKRKKLIGNGDKESM